MIENEKVIWKLLTSQIQADREIGSELLSIQEHCCEDEKYELHLKADAELRNKFGIFIWRVKNNMRGEFVIKTK